MKYDKLKPCLCGNSVKQQQSERSWWIQWPSVHEKEREGNIHVAWFVRTSARISLWLRAYIGGYSALDRTWVTGREAPLSTAAI